MNENEILSLSEVDTYFLIDSCGAFMWHMGHEMAHGRIPSEDHAAIQEEINKVSDLQKYAVDNLQRFGVDPASANDRENGDFWKWINFWNNWKNTMPDENWSAMNQLKEEKNHGINIFLKKVGNTVF